MQNIIIGFPKKEQSNALKEILAGYGYFHVVTCFSGAEIVRCACTGSGGIVICAMKLGDFMAEDIYDMLPCDYSMLVLLSRKQADMYLREEIFSLVLPVNKADLIKTIGMVMELTPPAKTVYFPDINGTEEKKKRSLNDKKTIGRAKLVLMNRHHITEDAAYRYIQKKSMDNGRKMTETARSILKDYS